MINNASIYLKYANLQMAAEAFWDRTDSGSDKGKLRFGNDRSSRFTEVLVDKFIADGWLMIDHRADTGTGFSGTLFKNSGTGELVISFRSTEFADDATRDNEATNTLEIKETGWAFGQIADMEKWYGDLKASGKLTGSDSFSVTGYSLGGHLATAFKLLHPVQANAVYTFNGAGVGSVKTGSLSEAVSIFTSRRNLLSNIDLFTTQAGKSLYQSIANAFHSGSNVSSPDVQNYLTQINALTSSSSADKDRLLSAMNRIKLVVADAERVNVGIPSGGTGAPARQVSTQNIDAIGLDYQLAVLQAGINTSSYKSGLVSGGWAAYSNNRAPAPGGNFTGFYDLYASAPPSAVANSQYHYGTKVPIFIEDQPLFRGSALTDLIGNTLTPGETKLLNSGFSQNDFGDTHSLVLIIDSLAIQDTLAKLASTVSQGMLTSILEAASNKRASSSIGTQGQAEGDVLENVLDGLRRIILGASPIDKTPAKLDGGTWANITDRDIFYNNLKQLTDSDAYKSLIEKSTITTPDLDLGGKAKIDFSAFLSLNSLSSVVINTSDAAALAKLKSANAALAAAWASDGQLSANQRAAGLGNFSDAWLSDRATMLMGLTQRNTNNADKAIGTSNTDFVDLGSNTLISQRTSGAGLNAPANKVIFGGDSADIITGSSNLLGDRLYGGAGVDTLNGGDGDSAADKLFGGSGADIYQFNSTFGKDSISDSDGQGSLTFDGAAVSGGKASGKANVWAGKDSAGNYEGYAIYADATSSTGNKLVITRAGNSSNTVTINNFNLTQATAPASNPINLSPPGNPCGTGVHMPIQYELSISSTFTI